MPMLNAFNTHSTLRLDLLIRFPSSIRRGGIRAHPTILLDCSRKLSLAAPRALKHTDITENLSWGPLTPSIKQHIPQHHTSILSGIMELKSMFLLKT